MMWTLISGRFRFVELRKLDVARPLITVIYTLR